MIPVFYSRCLAILVFLAIAISTQAADNPNVWEPKVKTVAVFKNGFGFFVREGNVKLVAELAKELRMLKAQ